LQEIVVRLLPPCEEPRYREQMQKHHYPGFLPKIEEPLWYLASWHDPWVALLSFSTPAWECAPQDRWIGWGMRHAYHRIRLLTDNSRFLILLPQHSFGHPVVLLETFVDPQRFPGTVDKDTSPLTGERKTLSLILSLRLRTSALLLVLTSSPTKTMEQNKSEPHPTHVSPVRNSIQYMQKPEQIDRGPFRRCLDKRPFG